MTPPIVARAASYSNRPSVLDASGSLTYEELLDRSAALAGDLLGLDQDLRGARVALLIRPGRTWVVAQWAIWRAGGVVIPLATSNPPPELAYALDDAEPVAVLSEPVLAERIRPAADARGIRTLVVPRPTPAHGPDLPALPDIDPDRPAMMIYTSGTTGRAKGVVTTHANVTAQISSLVEAWRWSRDDRILLVLPLHHVHGIVNVLGCALWSGACCEVHDGFDAEAVWDRFAEGGLTLFMAVPTMYARLIAVWDQAPPDRRGRWSAGAGALRLMVSGSAALPSGVLERWERITGHRLLERYGMTEIGMGLGNPIDGPRRAGHVGVPFPGVEVRLVAEDGAPCPAGSPGEIQVRGPQVFVEYWRRPEETRAAFVDGWFRTGDIGVFDQGSYRILGRSDIDIIKTGGEKVSALEVEDVLREHPSVRDCAVVGVPDPEWGERVSAAVVPADDTWDPEALQRWARDRLAPYKVPRDVRSVEALPRNAMGKVTKTAVRDLLRP